MRLYVYIVRSIAFAVGESVRDPDQGLPIAPPGAHPTAVVTAMAPKNDKKGKFAKGASAKAKTEAIVVSKKPSAKVTDIVPYSDKGTDIGVGTCASKCCWDGWWGSGREGGRVVRWQEVPAMWREWAHVEEYRLEG